MKFSTFKTPTALTIALISAGFPDDAEGRINRQLALGVNSNGIRGWSSTDTSDAIDALANGEEQEKTNDQNILDTLTTFKSHLVSKTTSSDTIHLSADQERPLIGLDALNPFAASTANRHLQTCWDQVGNNIRYVKEFENAFGEAVSLSSDGSVVAISSRSNHEMSAFSGHARVYKYDDSLGGWFQLGADLYGDSPGDQFGWSISLSSDGSMVAISSRFQYSYSRGGYAKIYRYNEASGQWEQVGDTIENAEQGSTNPQVGVTISLSYDGTIVAVGAHFNDVRGTDAGLTRVFKFNDNSNLWDQMGGDIYGETAGDWSGKSVSLSSDGTVLAIGGVRKSKARVFRYDENSASWNLIGGSFFVAGGDESGGYVSMNPDGNVLAVTNSDQVTVFKYDNNLNAWDQMGDDINRMGASSFFLSGNGRVIALGSLGYDEAIGLTRVFLYNELSQLWEQVGDSIEGEKAGDTSGSVALSYDGSKVAIGAPGGDYGRVFSTECNLVSKAPPIWSITEPTITTNNDNSKELSFIYDISVPAAVVDNDDLSIEPALYYKDCISKVADDNTVLDIINHADNKTSMSFDINIDNATIFNESNYISQSQDGSATISFCIHTDLRYDLYNKSNTTEYESITFREDNINVAVNLTAGFSVSSIDVENAAKGEKNTTAVVDNYAVKGYLGDANCNETNAPTTISQGEAAYICIDNESDGLDLERLKTLTCTNGVIQSNFVTDGVENIAIASVDDSASDQIKAAVLFFSAFYIDISKDVSCSGEVVLKVESGNVRRRMEEANLFEVADEEQDATFQLRLTLSGEEKADVMNAATPDVMDAAMSGATQGGISHIVAAGLITLVIFVW